MRKCLFFLIIGSILLGFAACGNQGNRSSLESTVATISSTETEPSFDLDAYKESVGKFRTHVMDNSLLLYNVGNYEINYLDALKSISGNSTSDDTADKGFEWLSGKTDANRESVDAAHQVIREEYAALILVEISGKEAEMLDEYVRSMYDGYSSLYDCVTSNSLSAYQLTTKINGAIDLINGADSDISLFLD